MKTLSTFNALFFIFILTLSCTLEDGQDGQDGADGTMVTASDWMPIEFTTINEEETNALMDIPVEGLQNFAEEGGVCLLYLRGFQTINNTWEV